MTPFQTSVHRHEETRTSELRVDVCTTHIIYMCALQERGSITEVSPALMAAPSC